MRLRFIAIGHAGQVCTVFGLDFPHGEWVEAGALSRADRERLAANPTFEAELDEDPPEGLEAARAFQSAALEPALAEDQPATSDQTEVTSDVAEAENVAPKRRPRPRAAKP